MSRKGRGIEIFSLSFLDVVSCGFGAIVLLLVISKIGEPEVAATLTETLRVETSVLQETLAETREQARALDQRLQQTREQVRQAQQELVEQNATLARLDAQTAESSSSELALQVLVGEMEAARQVLTEEMRRLQRRTAPPVPDRPVGGVPVDSEYIIFIIDTSGSMQQYAWRLVRRKMAEILAVHPQVKGIQVMNDMGEYMFSQYRGRWIPDTPARRNAVLRRLGSWAPFSNSSPVEGVTHAIQRFYSKDKKVSLYIFGDDFSRGGLQEVVESISRSNRRDKDGNTRVRIHAIGFPVLFTQQGADNNLIRFAALMRRLAEDNNGSFVGLTRLTE